MSRNKFQNQHHPIIENQALFIDDAGLWDFTYSSFHCSQAVAILMIGGNRKNMFIQVGAFIDVIPRKKAKRIISLAF